MAFIFHIIEKKDWDEVKAQGGAYSPDSLETDGFIHCAKADQILDIANHMFKGRSPEHLIILKINENDVRSTIKSEPPFEFPMAEILYPHIYGPLNLDAVEKEIDFPANEDGSFKLPKIL